MSSVEAGPKVKNLESVTGSTTGSRDGGTKEMERRRKIEEDKG